MYELSFTIEGLPETPNSLLGAHWTVRSSHAKRWKRHIELTIGRSKPKKPLERAQIKLTRVSSSEPDTDGLIGSFKPILDGLKHSGIIVDDKPSVIGIPVYAWEKGPMGKGYIKVEVKECESAS